MLPVQHHLQRATQLAVAAVTIQSDDQLKWLGAESADSTWRLPVLDETLLVDLSSERVATRAGLDVGPLWAFSRYTTWRPHRALIGCHPKSPSPISPRPDPTPRCTGSGPSRDCGNGGRRYSTVVCRGDKIGWACDSGG